MRMIGAVCSYDSITAERIVRRIIIIEITTIDEDMVCAIFQRVYWPPESLIYEIPDESTLELRIFSDKVPILLEPSKRITHGMSIFTLDERTRVF